MRAAAPENVVIIDTTPDRPRVLGEVDLFSAQVLVHERAIYMHESVQYYVDRLEWGERKAYVHKIDADHYTYANRAVTLKPLDIFGHAPTQGGRRIHGEVMVASLVTLFKKLKFGTDENVGWGPIDLPELELQTTAYWLTAERLASPWRRDDLDVALLGAGRAIQLRVSDLGSDAGDGAYNYQVSFAPHVSADTKKKLAAARAANDDAAARNAMRDAGISAVVASCGTALTTQQAQLLRRFTLKGVLSFDPDAAGQGAAAKSSEMLVAEGFQVNVAMLPAGDDPDNYIRRQGAAAYQEQLRNSRQYLEYLLDRTAAEHDFNKDDSRREFLGRMLTVAARIPDAAQRDQFADRLAHKARITEEVVRAKTHMIADVVCDQDTQSTLARWYGTALTTCMSV